MVLVDGAVEALREEVDAEMEASVDRREVTRAVGVGVEGFGAGSAAGILDRSGGWLCSTELKACAAW